MLEAAGKLAIDLNAVQENYRILQSKTRAGARVGAAVKADAYGLGAVPVSRALLDVGCKDFFVATPAEGVKLRSVIGEQPSIYILNGFYNSQAELYFGHNFIPALGSFIEIGSYRALGAQHGKALPAYLNFNLRMNRLGLGSVETQELLADRSRLEGIDIIGIKSHLACADDPDHPMNKEQLELFTALADQFPEAEKSLANSAGIFLGQDYHFDVLRPGMALYGLNPTPAKLSPMKRVAYLQVPVMRLRLVYKGAHVGYNATHRFDEDTPLATVSAGYADGVMRHLSNVGALYWKGYRCPIRGRVSMDLTTVDLSSVPKDERPKPGDFMEVLGENQSADDLATAAGTIGYEILTSLGQRYERVYLDSKVEPSASRAAG